ncbi:MAG: hypothetical protein IVW57_03470 [Ktedonobacterales bacterium]|nr:hypothetical protein [Ktedonobacterales bacterium]
MVLANADPAWLRTVGQIAGTLLLLELSIALFVMLVFAVALAVAVWWLREHVVPLLEQYGGQAREAMEKATQGSDRIIHGVAEFHGRKQAIETMARVLLLGRPRKGSATPVVPLGSAQRGTRRVTGNSPLGGYAPQDLPADPDRSTRDISAADLAPLTGER